MTNFKRKVLFGIVPILAIVMLTAFNCGGSEPIDEIEATCFISGYYPTGKGDYFSNENFGHILISENKQDTFLVGKEVRDICLSYQIPNLVDTEEYPLFADSLRFKYKISIIYRYAKEGESLRKSITTDWWDYVSSPLRERLEYIIVKSSKKVN
jgi:hypothetical protein